MIYRCGWVDVLPVRLHRTVSIAIYLPEKGERSKLQIVSVLCFCFFVLLPLSSCKLAVCMKVYLNFISVLLLIGFVAVACQNKKNAGEASADQSPLSVAVPSKSSFTVGDSILVNLSKPLNKVTVSWDNEPVLIVHLTENRLSFASAKETTGLHQLVVKGTTTGNEKTADTLTVELYSDVKPEKLTYSVLQTYPHQTSSFTQGLEFYGGDLYEGTGQNGQSRLMKTALQTGAVLKSVPLATQYFGEGITIVNNHIYQLTWTSGQCFRYTMDMTLEKILTYHTQGWGLTHRDSTLIVSDGSNKLSFYTPHFQKTGEVVVYDDKGPVMNLNELEYINGVILANVWQSNRIVRIDGTSGKVTGELLIDAPALVPIDTKENVLNGLAYQPTENALYITGKNWPSLFKIQVRGLLKSTTQKTVAFR